MNSDITQTETATDTHCCTSHSTLYVCESLHQTVSPAKCLSHRSTNSVQALNETLHSAPSTEINRAVELTR